jgi:hypothetical protein
LVRTPENGTLLIDASRQRQARAVRNATGGESWDDAAIRARSAKAEPSNRGWRVRTDAATHSYVIEKSENNRWQKVASFLVNIASCDVQ